MDESYLNSTFINVEEWKEKHLPGYAVLLSREEFLSVNR